VSWMSWDALPEQLFIPFHNLVSGQSYPRATRFAFSRYVNAETE